MSPFPLHIFPERALDASVITTIYVSVMIGAFLNLRYGWLLTGLIVPGYLIPLLLQKPSVVAITVLESVIAYLLVSLITERMTRFRMWSSFFGMDRFFAVILGAVLVRVVMDSVLLPIAGEWINANYGLNLDYRNSLQSFGLTMISLLAFGYMRSGLLRGLANLTLHTFLTWVVVYLVLMKFTNFNLSGLSFLYEEVASHVLSSPKTYIIMIVTAALASRMNLNYGWDFNGILVPAFIALMWNQPSRILLTFVEAFAVLWMSRGILRLPYFQKLTMEKGRQLILFFTVSFLYKAILGYLIPVIWPGTNSSDYFGFGYVLCSLIAMRIHTKEIAIKLTNCALQTSFAAVVIATGIGFSLAQAGINFTWIIPPTSTATAGPGTMETLASTPAPTTLEAFMEAKQIEVHGFQAQVSAPIGPTVGELDRFRKVLTLLEDAPEPGSPDAIQAATLLSASDYVLERCEQRYWVIQEKGTKRGWGFYVIDSQAKSKLLVEVPAPLEEKGTLQGGYSLFRLLGARAYACASNLRKPDRNASMDPLASPDTFLGVYHQIFGRYSTLQVRGSAPGTPPQLRIKRELPEGLDLAKIEARLGSLGLCWTSPSTPNSLADFSRTRFAEITLSARAFSRLSASTNGTGEASTAIPIELGTLQKDLTTALAAVAPEGSETYRPPLVDELVFLDEEVLTPIEILLNRDTPFDPSNTESLHELEPIAGAANLSGYILKILKDTATGSDFLVLTEQAASQRRWGTYYFRLGSSTRLTVAVPRPGMEPGALEFGRWAFEQLRGRSLLVAGALPLTRKDRASDVNRIAGFANLFSLVAQVETREAGRQPGMTLQVRGISNRADIPLPCLPESDMILWETQQGDASAPLGAFKALLGRSGFSIQAAEGQAEAAGLSAENIPVARYIRASQNKGVAVVWISPLLRRDLLPFEEDLALLHQIMAMHLPQADEDVAARMTQGDPGPAPDPVFLSLLAEYLQRRDVLLLNRLRHDWPQFGLRCWIDRASGRPYLVAGRQGSVSVVASLTRCEDKIGNAPWPTCPANLSIAEARHLLGSKTVRIVRSQP